MLNITKTRIFSYTILLSKLFFISTLFTFQVDAQNIPLNKNELVMLLNEELSGE